MKVITAVACPFCPSRDTIRTDHTIDCESWYCYQCHRGFDVHHAWPVTRSERTRYRPEVVRQLASPRHTQER